MLISLSGIIVLGMALSGAGLEEHGNRGINQQYACVTNRISMLADYGYLATLLRGTKSRRWRVGVRRGAHRGLPRGWREAWAW